MYTRILVPLDGSERAESILPHVIEMAEASGATVILTRVVDPVIVAQPHGAVFDQVQINIDRAQDYLEEVCRKMSTSGLKIKTALQHGPVVESIIAAANQYDADLIAIASHGRTGLGQVFYGSVAAGILHRADRPLLLIRSN